MAAATIRFAQAVAPAPLDYRQEVEAFRRHREQQLTSDDGWLTVAGLFWLKPGANRFGADRSNELVLPASAPARAGTFWLESGRVPSRLRRARRSRTRVGRSRSRCCAPTPAAPSPTCSRSAR